jgi:hypothetical protein
MVSHLKSLCDFGHMQSMTQMSEYGRMPGGNNGRKPLTSLYRSRLARVLHVLPTVRVLPAVLASCIIPPSLSTSDAGSTNSPPAILSVSTDQTDLIEPGPALFDVGSGTLNVTLIDTDVDDTLFTWLFVDYNVKGQHPPMSKCIESKNGMATRRTACPLNNLCTTDDIGTIRNLTIVVFDRRPDDTGTMRPFYQAMPPEGLSTSRFYFLRCQPAS